MGIRSTPWGNRKPILGSRPNPKAVADLGLLHAFLFNERGGLIVNDAVSGNSAPNAIGTFNGGWNWTQGPFGPATVGNGTSGYVSIPNANVTDLNNLVNLSFSLWINLKALTNNVENPLVCSKQAYNNNANFYLGFNDGAGNNANGLNWETTLNEGNANAYLTTAALAAVCTLVGQWNHIAITCYSGVSGVQSMVTTIYINGRSIALSGSDEAAGSTVIGSTTEPLLLGAANSLSPSVFHNGYMDNVLLANTIWTPDQVLRLYRDPFHWMQPMVRRAYSLPVAPPSGVPTWLWA